MEFCFCFFVLLSLFFISDDWKCLKFGSKVSGTWYDELNNVKHKVLLDTPVDVSGTQIYFFYWIGLKKLAYKHVNYNLVCALYPEIPGGAIKATPPPPPHHI